MVLIPLHGAAMGSYGVHWRLLEDILNSKDDVEPPKVPFTFNEDEYIDAVVMPHYIQERRVSVIKYFVKCSSVFSNLMTVCFLT